MGTFHQGKSELHGITVVVNTRGPEVYVGRCDDVVQGDVILLNADMHRAEGDDAEAGKRSWVAKAALYGVWGKLDRVVVPGAEVTEVRRLSEIEATP